MLIARLGLRLPRRTDPAVLLLALALGSSSAATPRADEVEGNLQKTFTVTAGGKLVIDADRGSIEVNPSSEDRVEVKVWRKARAGTTRKAEELLAKHEVTFEQEGNQVTVRARSPQLNSGWSWRGQHLDVRYEVQTPAKFTCDFKTAGGSVTVGDLTGDQRAQTAGGSIRFGQIDGTVWARTAGGSIDVARATGPIDTETAGGSIRIKEARATVSAETAGGSIHVDQVQGRIHASTAGGTVEIGQAAGPVQATTSGGSIRVSLTGSPEEDCRLETAGGSITLRVPKGLSAELDARTSAGSVTTELPLAVQGEVKRSVLRGKYGEGGRLLRLRTSAGSIRILEQ